MQRELNPVRHCRPGHCIEFGFYYESNGETLEILNRRMMRKLLGFCGFVKLKEIKGRSGDTINWVLK